MLSSMNKHEQMILSDFEPTIAGKTHSEILLMPRWVRRRWYKTITTLDEKREAMKFFEITRHDRISKTKKGRPGHPHSEATKAKISASLTGRVLSEEHRAKIGIASASRTHTEETKTRLSVSKSGRPLTKEHKTNISVAMSRPDVKARMRAAHIGNYTGENNPNWRGGISFEPYCPAFTNRQREHIRNLCDRTCTVCGESILQYSRIDNKTWMKLHIDHLDENKMQGCDDWEWRLTSLCPSCHGRMQNQKLPYHLLLRLLLLNNKRHQTHFLFGGN